MMKKILLLLIFHFSLACIAQEIPKSPNKTDKKGRRQGKWVLAYNASWKPTEVHDSIAYYRVLVYKDDKPKGVVTDYYASGKKQWEASLLTDRPEETIEGKAVWYHENGQINIEVSFVQGSKEGLELAYHPNGTKIYEILYLKGVPQGRVLHYDAQGEVVDAVYYQDGAPMPLQALWDKATEAYQQKKYEEAVTLLQDLYIAIKKKVGADDANCAQVLAYLWVAQSHLQKNDLAEKNIAEMCRVRELQKIPKDSTYRNWLYEAVVYYKSVDKLREIEALLLKILQIQADLTGKESDAYLAYRYTWGDYYPYQKRYEESEKVFNENIQVFKKKYPNQPRFYMPNLISLGFLHEKKQDYHKAEALYKEAIDSYKLHNDTTAQFATAIEQLASLYQAQDKNREALPLVQMLLALQKQRHGEQSPAYIEAVTYIIQIYRELGRFEEITPYIETKQKYYEAKYGKNSVGYASICFDFALLEQGKGNIPTARTHYLEAIEIYKHLDIENNENIKERYAEVLGYLGEMYAMQNEALKADATIYEAKEMIAKIKNKEIFLIAQLYQKIGITQMRICNYQDAEDAFQEAATITKKLFGESHHNHIVALANVCLLYNYTQRAEIAIEKLEALSKNIEQEYGTDNHSYIEVLNTLIISYEYLGKNKEAVPMRQRIVDFYWRVYGDMNHIYQEQLAKLVLNHMAAQQFAEAKQQLDKLQALADKKGIKTIDKVYYGNILSLKIALATMQKEYAKAKEYAQEANAIGKFLGKPKLGLGALAMNAITTGNFKEANEYYKTYIDLVIQELRQTFPYLSENQKVGFYNSEMEYHLDLYYYAALAEPLKITADSLQNAINKKERDKIFYIKHPNNADVFNYQLITKGLLFASHQKMKKAILNSKDEALLALFDTWQAKKEEMSKIFQEEDSKAKGEKKAKINAEIKDIEKKLALKSSYFTQAENPRYTWQDIQKKLKKGEALVEILAISAGQKINPAKKEKSDMYLAFIITPETKDYPLCVKIGTGDTLEGKYMRYYQNCIKARKADKYSYQQYWQVLADTLKSAKKIYFAPDGVYHKININALRNPQTGKFVIDEKEIQLITQARDIINFKNLSTALPADIILFGSPNFNNVPKDSTQKSEQAKPNRAIAQQLAQDTTQRFLNAGKIAELPGTEIEITNIATLCQQNTIQISKYLGDDANEATLKNIQSPAILHIATHGFFLAEVAQTQFETNDSRTEQRGGYGGFTEMDLQNPLRRCGLLLAYCQQVFSQDKTMKKMPEDGVLTAEEAQNLYLDKTELVVLSACETGLGDVKNGEGVYGLQRAFQTAGAKSVLMSLWTVSDEATQQLMTAFYTHWFKSKNKQEAFRKAQLEIKAKYPEAYFWGAFILVGE